HLLALYTFFFFFHHPATPDIYTLSLHDALPIYREIHRYGDDLSDHVVICTHADNTPAQEVPAFGGLLSTAEQNAVKEAKAKNRRSEEHTSELQSLAYLVCRLLLEKKKKKNKTHQ